MFSFSMRRLSQLGTVVGGSVASSTILSEIHNEAAPPRGPVQSIRVSTNFEADVDGPMSEYVVVKDDKSPSIANEAEDAALDVIVSQPEILLDCLPAEYVVRQPSEATRLVHLVSNNHGLIEKVKSQIKKRRAEKEHIEYVEKPPALEFSLENTASQMWDQLRADYPCVLCQDVLAAPTLLECSHNLCGICAEELLTQCVPCDPNNDGNVVMVACPTCRTEISQPPVFERLLDEKIEECTRSVPDCVSKRDWQERREKFFSLRRARQAQTEKLKTQENNTTSNTGASYVASFFNELNIGLDTPPQPTEYYEHEEYWVAAIAFMVFLLAGIVKYSR